MLIYLFIILYLFACIVIYDICHGNIGRLFFQYTTLFLFIFTVAFSYHIGTDNQGYDFWYTYLLPTLNHFRFTSFDWEPFFSLFCSLLKTFGADWIVARLVIVAIINISIYVFVKRYFKKCFFTIFLMYFILYYYELNCEAIRQSLSMSIVLLAWPYFERGNIVKFYVLVVVATLFHYSGALAFIFPMIRAVNFDFKGLSVIVAVALSGASINFFAADFLSLLTQYSGGILSRFESNYLGNNQEITMLNINGILFTLILKILPLYIASKYLQRLQKFKAIIPGLWIFALFMTLQMFVPPVFRVCNFFCVFALGSFTEVIYYRLSRHDVSSIFFKFQKITAFYIVSAFILQSLFYYKSSNELTGVTNVQRVVPYVSIFNPIRVPWRY